MALITTERLSLRKITAADAQFILHLLNEPSFIANIGDRGVRNLAAARDYIETRFVKSYADHGFGLYLIELADATPIGICGFVRRDTLPAADLGFALLSQFEKKGYAFEAAMATMTYGHKTLNLPEVLAITTQDNLSSGKLLLKLGFSFQHLISMQGDEQELRLYKFIAEDE